MAVYHVSIVIWTPILTGHNKVVSGLSTQSQRQRQRRRCWSGMSACILSIYAINVYKKIINAIILLAFIILIISHEMYIKSFVIWKCDWLTQTYKFPWASLFNTSAFSVVHLVVGPTVLEWILLTAALLHGRPNCNLHELQKYSTRSFTDRLKMSTLY